MQGKQNNHSRGPTRIDKRLRDGMILKKRAGASKDRPIGWCEDPPLYRTIFPRMQWERFWTIEDAGDAIRMEMQDPHTRLSLVPVKYGDIPALVREGWIRPLDGFFSRDYLAEFAAPALELSRMNGKLYAIPDDITPFVYFVNRDILGRIGGAVPGTWDEAGTFAVQAARLGCHAFGLPGLSTSFRAGFLLSLLGSNGVDLKNGMAGLINNPERLLECYEWLQKMVYRYKLLPRDVFIAGTDPQLARNERLRAASGFAWLSAFKDLTEEEISRLVLLPFPRGPSANASIECSIPLKGRAWCMPWNSIDPGEGLHVLRSLYTPRVCRALHSEAFPFLAWKGCWDNPQVHRQYPLYKYAGNLISDKAMVFSHGECSHEGRLSVTLRGTLLDRAEGGEWVRRLGSSPTQSQGGGGISLPVLLHKVASSSCKVMGVRGIADDLGITMRSLSRLFRAAMKEDIGAYMRKSRMNIAHELLAMSGNTVKEVASRVGYENVSAFCRAYRKFWGHVPHEDRLNPSQAGKKSKAGPGRR